MISRLIRSITTFAAVCIAYFAYSLLLVRFIEPSVAQRAVGDKASRPSLENPQNTRLSSIFPPGSWELDQPKVLETPSGMLLLKELKEVGENCLELRPCTLIFLPEEGKGQQRQIVLQASEAAILMFEGPLNLARGQIGRLNSGRLEGNVTIRSPESRAGADDALEILTDNVQMTPRQILAPNQIRFTYGKNSGSGSDLIIALDPPPNKGPADKRSQVKIGSFKSLELVRVDQILLQLDSPKGFGEGTVLREKSGSPSQMQVHVTCQGPFRYDFQARTAWFEKTVQAIRSNSEGPDDRLSCDRLAAYFSASASPRDKPPANDISQRAGLSGLKVERIEALGSPVVVDAPSYAAAARGELLEYNFKTREARIEDSKKAMLRYKQINVETPRIEYQFGEDRLLGQMQADGPGRLAGALPDDPSRTFEAVWNSRVILQPHKGDHALSLLAGASVRVHDVGDFSANNVHVWIREIAVPQPNSKKLKFRFEPVRALAEENVRVDSRQLTGRTDRAEIWIRYAEPVKPEENVPSDPAVPGKTPPKRDLADRQQPDQESRQRFSVAGRHLQAQLFRSGEEMLVEHLIADGNVHFLETQTEKPDEIPIAIRGDVVQVDHANKPHARVRVQGGPAEVSARGLTLVGGNLQLNRGDNRMWIVGPGRMTLPPRRPSAETHAGSPQGMGATGPVSFAWKERMDFDGLNARFRRDVEVTGTQISKTGEVSDLKVNGQDLGVTLTHRVQFTEDKQHPDLGVREMQFDGDVYLQNSGRRNGQQTSLERMQVRDLTIDGATGRLRAQGPGWGSTARRGEGLSAGRFSPSDRASQDSELIYVRVDFEGQVTGNANSRDVEFDGRTNTIYGPIEAWDQVLDPDPPEGLGKEQFLLTSDRLTVADMGSTTGDELSAVELVADGNATIEGREFSARGSRISYAKAKELVVLDGDGRNDAELWMKGSKTPDAAAQQIRYWAGNNSIQVDGGRFLNLTHAGASSGLLRP
jgi:hypothetical protein